MEKQTDERKQSEPSETCVSKSAVERLVSQFRHNAAEYDSLAMMGQTAPHAHLRVEAEGHAARADCLRNCADSLEKLIG